MHLTGVLIITRAAQGMPPQHLGVESVTLAANGVRIDPPTKPRAPPTAVTKVILSVDWSLVGAGEEVGALQSSTTSATSA